MPMAVNTGRLAGLLYLVVVATGIFSLAYVPGRLVSAGDPQATLANIAAFEPLWRQGIAAFLLMQVAFLLLPFTFHALLRPAGRVAAIAMVALAVTSVPLGLAALVHRLDLLSLVSDPALSSLLGPERSNEEAMLSMKAYGNGLRVTKLFWGLWLLPLGWLVFRSACVPRILGLLLMLGCCGYLLQVFGDLLMSGYANSIIAAYAPLPASIGEIGTCLWLLAFGARPPRAP